MAQARLDRRWRSGAQDALSKILAVLPAAARAAAESLAVYAPHGGLPARAAHAGDPA